MLRKLICATFVLVCGVSIALADEFGASITKVDGNNVTFTKMKKGEKGEAMTLPAAKDVKVVTGKYNKDTKSFEVGEALAGGLKNEKLSNIGEKGQRARIITSDDGKTITEIRIMQGGRKKAA
jgi:hypothetical protein